MQSDGIGDRYGINERGDVGLIGSQGVDEILVRASEGLPSIGGSKAVRGVSGRIS